MTEAIYERLAKHLDGLPGGFPRSDTGVELRILRRLFTEEEAELTIQLSMRPEPAAKIAKRLEREPEQIAQLLDAMSRKGLIFRIDKTGTPAYSASQYVVGIWEYHVKDLDPELIKDMNEYLPTLFDMEVWKKAPQLRTIPVGESVFQSRDILPYEEIRTLVKSRSKIAVAPCICRREHNMIGEGCGRPEESCLVFGRAADYYIGNGTGREITVEEALAILEEAEKNALVLQPSNSQNIINVCTCCGCCCQVLKAYKRHPNPASIVSTPFKLEVISEDCAGCGDCIERCQMDALWLEDNVIAHDERRCIGCGLCTTVCPSDCLHLVRKSEEELKSIPPTMFDTYVEIVKARGGD
jgi:electron transport complex protein RnfB